MTELENIYIFYDPLKIVGDTSGNCRIEDVVEIKNAGGFAWNLFFAVQESAECLVWFRLFPGQSVRYSLPYPHCCSTALLPTRQKNMFLLPFQGLRQRMRAVLPGICFLPCRKVQNVLAPTVRQDCQDRYLRWNSLGREQASRIFFPLPVDFNSHLLHPPVYHGIDKRLLIHEFFKTRHPGSPINADSLVIKFLPDRVGA